MTETRRAKLVVGIFVAAAVAVFSFLAVKLGGISLRPRIRGSAVFDDVTGIVPGARVTVAGVGVGQVRILAAADGRARVDFVLFEGHGIREGAEVEVRARSLLGEKYLAIVPGPPGGAELRDGFTLPARPTGPTIDDVLARLTPLIDRMPIEELAQDLEDIHRFLDGALPRLESLLAEANLAEVQASARAVREVLETERPALHRAITAMADVAEAYRPGARENAKALNESLENLRGATADLASLTGEGESEEVKALREALRRLPATLDRIDATLATLQKLDPLIERLGKLDQEELHRILREEGVRIRFTSPD